MKILAPLLAAVLLGMQGLPKPVQPAFLVTLQAPDTVATVEATWKRPGTPGTWTLRYPWRSEAVYVMDSVTTQTFSVSDTADVTSAVFEVPRFWEDVTALFCVRSFYQGRESGERCADYVIPARPLPPPDSLEIRVTHAQTVEYGGDWYVTLRWDSVAGADFFGRQYARPELRLLG
jgi:hypothetical protein